MSALGAIIGLAVAIFLIIRRLQAVYALMLGAFLGGIIGGMGLAGTTASMIAGVGDVVPAIVRIISAGVLSGALVVSGAAESISSGIIRIFGHRRAAAAIAIATALLTATGVFVDVAVITVAPVALSAGSRLGISRPVLLMMMIGGGKCGNVISPNPNTIIAAENFAADLYSVMYANLIPAVIGLLFTVFIVRKLMDRHSKHGETSSGQYHAPATDAALPSFAASCAGPAAAILLLALRPLASVTVDPLLALPAGGIVCLLACRKPGIILSSLKYGLDKMAPIAVLLVGTGTLAGIIKASTLKEAILSSLTAAGMPESILAPVSGALMSAATASTTAGATIASSSFADIILASGVAGIWGAAMINAGATVVDHLPHGSFFHATGGAADISITDRLRLIPYECAVGAVIATASYVCFLISQ